MKPLKIGAGSVVTFYPDISDNLTLAESKRFAFTLTRVSRFKMKSQGVRTIIQSDGTIAQLPDDVALIKLHVTGILNPPSLEMPNGDQREMTLDDVFNVPELSDVASQLDNEVSKLIRTSQEFEVKNS